MTLRIRVFVQLRNLFPEELQTTKQKIIYNNVTEDLFVKKKNDIKLKTLQHGKYKKCLPCYKLKLKFCSHSLQRKQKLERQLRSGLTIKRFDSEAVFFRMDWEAIISDGQKHFRETKNPLCKISNA